MLKAESYGKGKEAILLLAFNLDSIHAAKQYFKESDRSFRLSSLNPPVLCVVILYW